VAKLVSKSPYDIALKADGHAPCVRKGRARRTQSNLKGADFEEVTVWWERPKKSAWFLTGTAR
jgi:hypothetical protein